MESTTLEKQIPFAGNIMDLNKDKRRWILVEDYPAKAEYLISYILQQHPQDDIYWILPDNTNYNHPTYVKELQSDSELKPFKMPLILEDNKIEVVEGTIHFFACQTEAEFTQVFQPFLRLDGNILLLDIELKNFGKPGPNTAFLAPQAKRLLGGQGQKNLVTIMSGVANFAEVKRRIDDTEEDRIVALGGRWQFVYSSLPKDCWAVVNESHRRWQKVFNRNQFSLSDFLEKMAEMNQHQCHNWQNESASKQQYYISTERWHEEWNMPIQLSYLNQLLGYDPEQFVADLDLKKSNGYFREGSPTCNALKVMGTKDKDTHSFSLLGTAFIAWAAYRNLFPEGAAHDHFLKAIRKATERNARHQFITPPQTLPTLQKTIHQLYELFGTLFITTEEAAEQLDNVRDVELDAKGLSFHLNINPEKLHRAMTQEYRKRLLGNKEIGGGTSSKKIVSYLAQSNYCDRLLMDKKPLVGATYGLLLFAAGEDNAHGTILKFGNEI